MIPYKCPFCNTQLIFKHKVPKDYFVVFDVDADVYYCECGNKIVSQAFFNRDGSPQIFYDSKWMYRKDGTWLFLEDRGNGHGCWEKQKQNPTIMRFCFR
jgi:hypothetical protein